MSFGLEFNARSVPAADIAQSFVPPEPHFAKLLTRNHTLLLGPRGSGKTTLLKMLTIRALRNWQHWQAAELTKQITFNSAFIAADNAWGKQLDSLETLARGSRVKDAAFVIHTIRALIHAMRGAVELGRSPVPHLSHLSAELSSAQEEDFVRFVADRLSIRPMVNSLLGAEIALEAKLDSINGGDREHSFVIDTFASKISLLVRAFNGLAGDDDRRWALLFDELEIAPAAVKTFLLTGIRSIDERIVVKLAIAPYMDDAQLEAHPTSPHRFHDYHIVQLSYPNKEDATHFGTELFLKTFQRLGFQAETLREIFQEPHGGTGFGRRNRPTIKRREVPAEFRSLAQKDESFQEYVDERRLFAEDYRFSESSSAQDIRKVYPIVIARDFYLRGFKDGKALQDRSRKSYSLYTGMPSVVEITEGNPRAILTFIIPLIQEFEQYVARTNSTGAVPVSMQSSAISRVELLLTSLLQVVPLDLPGFDVGKGLLDFVDKIGEAFEDRLLGQRFRTDYVGTFTVDDNLSIGAVAAVGKALNAGALVHVPSQDGGSDSLLRGLRGQRFRLSYALAPRHRLLLTLGDRINLSTLLLEWKGLRLSGPQPSLFEPEAP